MVEEDRCRYQPIEIAARTSGCGNSPLHPPERRRAWNGNGGLDSAGCVGEGLDSEREVGGGVEALFPVFLQTTADDALQTGRLIRGHLGDRRLLVKDSARGVGVGSSVKGAFAGQHLEEDCPEGEDVGASVRDLTANLFRRHITNGAHHCTGTCVLQNRLRACKGIGLRLGELGQAKVENLDAPIFRDEQVFGFEVAMNDAVFVGGVQPVSDLHGIVDCGAYRQGTAPQLLAQGLSLQKFGHDVRDAVLPAHLMDGENVGVVQGRRRFGFLLKPAETLRVGRVGIGQNLDGDFAFQDGIAGAIHLTHAPRA